jgi:hypothetical protein
MRTFLLRNTRKIFNANLYSALIAWKFALIIVYTWIFPQPEDLFGHYTLAFGLTASFYIFSGMRARFLVLRSIYSIRQLKDLTIGMTCLGIGATVVVLWLNAPSDILLIIMLVSAAKFLETYLDAGTSYIQNILGRKKAFDILNQNGLLIALGFTLALPFGLEYSIAAECAVLVFTVTRQWLVIKAQETERQPFSFLGLFNVVGEAVEFTITATLNAAQITYFLYFCTSVYPQPQTLFVAKLFAVQAIASRMMTGNNFYFKDALAGFFDKSGTMVRLFVTIVTGTSLAGYIVTEQFYGVPIIYPMIFIGVGFTLVNCMNIILRQHMMMLIGTRKLGMLHIVELAIVVGLTQLVPISITTALALFLIMRLIRVVVLTTPAFKEEVGIRK